MTKSNSVILSSSLRIQHAKFNSSIEMYCARFCDVKISFRNNTRAIFFSARRFPHEQFYETFHMLECWSFDPVIIANFDESLT